ncbi:microfibril associated protein 5 isoform X1 [Boleophthalmus pectinirostris]|uniref:microfibril associated protein 5 isoform X1 n=1 Tax=Boleophthalmus pectinirostris TaxID=150288 RepID=UPI0024323238|nr:microfibril associated protein 5 isoform X1 [Boleophthalmus pectinirostris]
MTNIYHKYHSTTRNYSKNVKICFKECASSVQVKFKLYCTSRIQINHLLHRITIIKHIIKRLVQITHCFEPFHIYFFFSVCAECREEMYPCSRMYSVHRPMKKCIGGFCLYSLQRMYVINNEICTRTVCPQDEYLKAELCRERSGWPRRIERSSNQRRRCRSRRGNPDTWANKV